MPKEFRHVTVNPNRLSEVVNLIKNTSTFFSGFTVYCSKENWGMMLKQGNCWLGNKIHHYELDYNYSYDMEYFPRLLPIGDFLEQDPDSKHGSMMLKQKKEWGEWRGDENNELNRFFMHHQQILRNYFRKPVDSLKQTALGKILLKYTLPLHSTVIYPRFLSLLGMIQRRVKNILCSPVRFNDPPDEKLEDKDGREEYNQSVPPLTYLLPIYLDPQKEQPHISALREFINSNERVNTKTLKPEKRIELVRIFAKFLEKEGERWTQMSPQEQAEYRIINEIHGAQERKVWARNEMLRLRCSNSRCPTNIDTNKKLLRDAYPQYFHVPSNLIYHEERGHAAKYRVRGKKAEQNKNKDREFIKNRVVQESGSIMPTTFDEENHYAQRPLGRTVVRTDCPHCGFELTRYQEIK
ncbi:MAG: hypothetical protein K0S63_436 [Gammaproteobacteria bacterium]|nr:hypothetical protein [Gammaproteobacteria bacterium]